MILCFIASLHTFCVFTHAQIKQAVTQLKHIYKYNIAQWEPFNLYLCNFDRNVEVFNI